MKTITLKGLYLITTLFCTSMFAQGTGVSLSNNQTNQGIQNKVVSSTSSVSSVLVLGAPGDPTWLDDVEAKLDNTGLVNADTFLTSGGTPTLAQLLTYDSVLVFTDASAVDPVGFGDILASYIEAGGGVVNATFTANVPITGNFTAYDLYTNSGQGNGTNLGIGTIYEPSHPTLNGVSSFDGGTASYHNTGGTIAAGASVVAEYTTGAPLIIVKENVGPAATRTAFLNFYPPSFDARDDFWNITSDGDILMANALNWTAFAGGANVLIAGAPGNPDWLLDVELKVESSGEFQADTFLTSAGTPTLAELQNYDAVFIFTDAGAADPVAFGNVLAQYADGGGAILDATFTPNVPITGGFTSYELYSVSGQGNGTNLGIGTINNPSHPTLNGVNTFDGGTASFHNTGGTIAAGATVIAEYTNGAPLIIVNEDMGPSLVKRAFLNFYPPSIDVRDDFWDTTSDGALIITNAISWLLSIDTNSAPTAQCQAFTATLDSNGNATITAADIDNGSLDTDGTITLSIDVATFTCNDLGDNTVTLTVTDDDGAVDTCSAIVTVVDSENPTIVCPAPLTVMINQGDMFTIPDYITTGDATVADNCTFSTVQDPLPGSMVAMGTYTIEIDVTDASGNTASCSFQLTVDEILGTNDFNEVSFKLYPNPATSQITIEGTFDIASVVIYNLLGQEVLTTNSEILNIEDLTSGMYLVNIIDIEGNKSTTRFIKK